MLDDPPHGGPVAESTTILEQHHASAAWLVSRDPRRALEARAMDRVFDLYVHEPMQRLVDDRLRPLDRRDPLGVERAHATLTTAYDLLERTLSTRPFAAGDAFTLADCAAAPALHYANAVCTRSETRTRTCARTSSASAPARLSPACSPRPRRTRTCSRAHATDAPRRGRHAARHDASMAARSPGRSYPRVMRFPRPEEIPALDRQAIFDDVAPYRGMSAAELDEARHGLCRFAAEQRATWTARARDYQDPLSPEADALWLRLVRAYRTRGTAG